MQNEHHEQGPRVRGTLADLPDPRSEASQVRQALHILLAGAGWVLFFYWWSIVLGRVSSREIRFTALFIGISLVVVVAATVVWVLHNISIFRRRGPRTKVRPVDEQVRVDHLGRSLRMETDGDALRSARLVRVLVDGGRKIYHSSESSP
jgi:hypothetical protein